MENTRENVIKLLRAMIKSKRELSVSLGNKLKTFANTLWSEQNALATVVDLLEDQSFFNEYAGIYFGNCKEEDQDNG